MLDPGHGGKDPGAIGVAGTHEKQVVLAAAQDLKRRLEAGGRYRVRLTRARDDFVPLSDRVAMAERHGAALFVSLHADALDRPDVRGASVYVFAARASDSQSARLAARENAADRFIAREFRAYRPEVRDILSALVLRETFAGAAAVQHCLVRQLRRQVFLLRNPTRRAGFAVLRSATIPSALVEMGFMSNRQDERLLRLPGHRRKLATALAAAIDEWFQQQPGRRIVTG
ncbi:N-acetylmuramoyl-L-alanine amidase family protein [Rhodovastum atsumiense]|nr:N-acetylmuramoyl-L-alanine amidase [Rhodovastum atsumiense]